MSVWLEVGAGLVVSAVIVFSSAFFARRAYRLSTGRGKYFFSERPWTRRDRTLIRQIAVGGVLNESNWFPINTVHPCKSKEEMRNWLRGSWDIDDSYGAAGTIEHMMAGGHCRIFDRIIALAPQMNVDTLQKHLELQFPGNPAHFSELREFIDNHAACLPTLEAWGYAASPADWERGTRAYDLGRAVTVARVAYGAGYLTEREAKGFVAEVATLSAQAFASWREFAVSYMLGRTIWGGVGHPELEEMHHIVTQLQTHPRSPWVTEGWFPSAAVERA